VGGAPGVAGRAMGERVSSLWLLDDWLVELWACRLVLASCGVGMGRAVVGTLLGPEGTRRVGGCCLGCRACLWWSYRLAVCGLFPWWWGWWLRWGWVWWLFEMCIVDASIFVVKLLRAHGGCLGIRDR
jgi:hypothetical protein